MKSNCLIFFKLNFSFLIFFISGHKLVFEGQKIVFYGKKMVFCDEKLV